MKLVCFVPLTAVNPADGRSGDADGIPRGIPVPFPFTSETSIVIGSCIGESALLSSVLSPDVRIG